MTNIQISDKATKQIEAVIGTADPAAIANVFERLAQNEEVILAAWTHNRSAEEIRQSAVECDAAMERIKAGRGLPMRQTIRDIADRVGVEINR